VILHVFAVHSSELRHHGVSSLNRILERPGLQSFRSWPKRPWVEENRNEANRPIRI